MDKEQERLKREQEKAQKANQDKLKKAEDAKIRKEERAELKKEREQERKQQKKDLEKIVKDITKPLPRIVKDRFEEGKAQVEAVVDDVTGPLKDVATEVKKLFSKEAYAKRFEQNFFGNNSTYFAAKNLFKDLTKEKKVDEDKQTVSKRETVRTPVNDGTSPTFKLLFNALAANDSPLMKMQKDIQELVKIQTFVLDGMKKQIWNQMKAEESDSIERNRESLLLEERKGREDQKQTTLLEETLKHHKESDKKLSSIFSFLPSFFGGGVGGGVGGFLAGSIIPKALKTLKFLANVATLGTAGMAIGGVKKLFGKGTTAGGSVAAATDLADVTQSIANDNKKEVAKGKKRLGKTVANAGKGFIRNVFGAIGTSLKFALRASGVFSLALTIADAFQGAMNAEKMGVSKSSGVIGSILAGFKTKGIEGAFVNGGKWAAIGATAGLVFGPFGAIAGGVIGGLFGAILGYFGQEKVSKWIDKLDFGTALSNFWDKIRKSFITLLDNIPLPFSDVLANLLRTKEERAVRDMDIEIEGLNKKLSKIDEKSKNKVQDINEGVGKFEEVRYKLQYGHKNTAADVEASDIRELNALSIQKAKTLEEIARKKRELEKLQQKSNLPALESKNMRNKFDVAQTEAKVQESRRMMAKQSVERPVVVQQMPVQQTVNNMPSNVVIQTSVSNSDSTFERVRQNNFSKW